MPGVIAQYAVVGLLVAWAAWFMGRQMLGLFRGSGGGCQSGQCGGCQMNSKRPQGPLVSLAPLPMDAKTQAVQSPSTR